MEFIYPILQKRYVDFNIMTQNKIFALSTKMIVSSDFHKYAFKRAFPKYKDKVYTIPGHLVESLRKLPIKTRIKTILFVGAYDGNLNAINSIKTISKMMPDIDFVIAGFGVPKKRNGNLVYYGPYSEKERDYLFKKADMCIAPMTESSGGKRAKVIEYLTYGRLVIGTSKAFEGFDGIINNINAVVEDVIEKYPERINWLNKHPETFIKMQKRALSLLKTHGLQSLVKRWNTILN